MLALELIAGAVFVSCCASPDTNQSDEPTFRDIGAYRYDMLKRLTKSWRNPQLQKNLVLLVGVSRDGSLVKLPGSKLGFNALVDSSSGNQRFDSEALQAINHTQFAALPKGYPDNSACLQIDFGAVRAIQMMSEIPLECDYKDYNDREHLTANATLELVLGKQAIVRNNPKEALFHFERLSNFVLQNTDRVLFRVMAMRVAITLTGNSGGTRYCNGNDMFKYVNSDSHNRIELPEVTASSGKVTKGTVGNCPGIELLNRYSGYQAVNFANSDYELCNAIRSYNSGDFVGAERFASTAEKNAMEELCKTYIPILIAFDSLKNSTAAERFLSKANTSYPHSCESCICLTQEYARVLRILGRKKEAEVLDQQAMAIQSRLMDRITTRVLDGGGGAGFGGGGIATTFPRSATRAIGNIGPYRKDLLMRLAKNWTRQANGTVPVVVIELAKDGTLRSVVISVSSGSKESDKAAIEAVKKTQFAPLPDWYRGDKLTFKIELSKVEAVSQ